jgi:hypothetical protein
VSRQAQWLDSRFARLIILAIKASVFSLEKEGRIEMNTLPLPGGAATGAVRTWLKVEGLAVIALSVLLYWHSGSRWWIFAALLLAPDLSMLAYLRNPRVGALCYNVVHSYLLPLGLATVAVTVDRAGMLPYLFIWTAHIGLDRFLGYGLKYPGAFGETHLGTLRGGFEKNGGAPGDGR